MEKVLRLDRRSPGLQSPAPYSPRIGRGTRVSPEESAYQLRDVVYPAQGRCIPLRLCFDLTHGAPASTAGGSRRRAHAVSRTGDEESSGSADVRRRSPYSLPDERYAAATWRSAPAATQCAAGPRSRVMVSCAPSHSSTTPNFDSGVYSNYAGVHQAPEPPSYSTVPPGGGLYNRPYAAQPQQYFDERSPWACMPFQQDLLTTCRHGSPSQETTLTPLQPAFPQKYLPEMPPR